MIKSIKQIIFPGLSSSSAPKTDAQNFYRALTLITPIGFLFAWTYYYRYNSPYLAGVLCFYMASVYVFSFLSQRIEWFSRRWALHFGLFLYLSLFFQLGLHTDGPNGNGSLWILSTVFMAMNFVDKKELVIWAIVSMFAVSLYYYEPFMSQFQSVIPEEYTTYYRFSSQMAIGVVIAITGYYSIHSKQKSLLDKEEAIKAANQTSNLASLGEMAGGIAHEINNPLMIISGSAMVIEKQLQKEEVNTEKIMKHIQTIVKTTKRAANIIKGLKNLARDGINDEKEDVTIVSVLDDIMSFMENKLSHSGVELIYDKNTPMFNKTFSLYRVQFSQVLLNLITNSFYAVEELDEKWIRIDMEEMGKDFIVRVTDSGKGIPPEIQDKIFTPFFTTKPVGKGTGLGLPLCHNIMTTCGGGLYYDKNYANTSFVIVLPSQDFIKEYKVEAA